MQEAKDEMMEFVDYPGNSQLWEPVSLEYAVFLINPL